MQQIHTGKPNATAVEMDSYRYRQVEQVGLENLAHGLPRGTVAAQ